MVSIELDFDISTSAASKAYSHEDDPRWQTISKWEYKTWKIKKYPYVYLVSFDWYIRQLLFCRKLGPYPGPIDFRVLKSTDVWKAATEASLKSHVAGCGGYVCFKADDYDRFVKLYGVIGTPCIRSGKKSEMSDPPFDLASVF